MYQNFRGMRQRTALLDQYCSTLGLLSERHRAEAALRLAKENAERAAQAAQSASHAKTEFLANMSHEIRTPMNGMLSVVDLLSRTELNDRQRKLINIAHNSADTLLNIINDILDFSRIEAGKLELDSVDFDLRQTICDVIDLLAESAQNKGLELTCFVSREVPQWVHGDPTRLRQIVFNLVGNGIKFTDRGEVAVRIDAEQMTDESTVLSVKVTDTGIGIEPELIGKILQPFEQADGSITRRFGGTGLGLAIARQLVEMMGGNLAIESRPGKGSTFGFTVGVRKSGANAERMLDQPFDLAGSRVLIVDDNATNREILNYHLSDWGTDPEAASDGKHALELLKAAADRGRPFDIAILDMMMRGMSGIDLAQAIKADPQIAGTHLVVLTPIGRQNSPSEARRLQIQSFLTKPVRQSELRDQIGELLGVNVQKEAPTPQFIARSEARVRDGGPPLGGAILLAEDNPVNQEVTRESLATLGCRVDTVATGLEAVAAFERRIYDLVLMDCQMPDMDGLEATKKLRLMEQAQPRGRRTPIIAVTANAFRGERERCLAAGMDDYLTKPFIQDDLLRILRRWIETPPSTHGRADESTVMRTSPRTPPTDMAECEDFDDSALDNIRTLYGAKSDDAIGHLIQIYLESTPRYLADLRGSFADGNVAGVTMTTHKLKSSSATVGAKKMADRCREMERLAGSGSLEEALRDLDLLESDFERVRDILDGRRVNRNRDCA